MGNIGDIQKLCEGRDLIGQSGKGDKKREVAGTSCGAVTGDVPGTERANRAIVAELVPRWEAERAGLTVAIRIVIGVLSWVMGPLDGRGAEASGGGDRAGGSGRSGLRRERGFSRGAENDCAVVWPPSGGWVGAIGAASRVGSEG